MSTKSTDDDNEKGPGSTPPVKSKGYPEQQPRDRDEARQPPADPAKPPDGDSSPTGEG